MNHHPPLGVLTDHLQCLLHAECQIGFALLKLFDQASHPKLRELIAESMRVGDRHACKLVGVCNRLGVVPRAAGCPFSEIIRDCEHGPAKTAGASARHLMVLARLRRLHLYKLHEYELLHQLATGCHLPAMVFRELLQDEILMARKIQDLTGEACAGSGHEPPPARHAPRMPELCNPPGQSGVLH